MRAIRLAAAFLLLGCASTLQPAGTREIPSSGHISSEAAARRGLEDQIAAWNRGDLETALLAYWDSPQMTWVSKAGVERGFADFANGMKTDFAEPAAMGTYSAEMLDARSLGEEGAVIVFRWQIVRDGKRVMGGTSTQLWRPIEGSWRAVLEHAS